MIYLTLIYSFFLTRNEVLCHLKHEDKDRHSYFTQLEHLARQMRELPLPTDSVRHHLWLFDVDFVF